MKTLSMAAVMCVLFAFADNDGYPDVAISNYNHDNISVMLNHYTILTDVEEAGIVQHMPGAFHLSQNYPNPFNPRTTIAYNLPSKAEVTISVYNMLGQRVKVFHEGMRAAGWSRGFFFGDSADVTLSHFNTCLAPVIRERFG
ncbi:MAG: T9SS type A sorting domain-containing protein [Candidatus Zixiibacteriota bacterium]|nr:MAG: T9SS type A sorting domain-containing protein [candidate division Zixibacteria bacterium]